ncbi:hypothetical protein D3C76_1782580 [compost metagenome]
MHYHQGHQQHRQHRQASQACGNTQKQQQRASYLGKNCQTQGQRWAQAEWVFDTLQLPAPVQ